MSSSKKILKNSLEWIPFDMVNFFGCCYQGRFYTIKPNFLIFTSSQNQVFLLSLLDLASVFCLSLSCLSLGKVSNYHSGRWMLCLFNTYRGYNTIKEQIRKKAHLKNMSVFYASKLRKTSLLLRLRADPSQWTPPIGNIHSFSQIAITIEPMLQLLYSLRFRISKTCAL